MAEVLAASPKEGKLAMKKAKEVYKLKAGSSSMEVAILSDAREPHDVCLCVNFHQ